jgi:uncharacterized protein YihD (DUF1040 family)
MRDAQRIDEVLNELRAIWVRQPDLRLGQLVVIAISPQEPQPEIFYAEDEVLLEGLRRYRTQADVGR